MYSGFQASSLVQGLGATAGASIGSTLAFATFRLPASGTGTISPVTSFLTILAMSGLLALSFICFVIAFRLIVRTRTA